jgi:hypothetical protein
MNREEFMNFINWLELNTPVTSWMVNGIHIWPLLRIKMYFENLKKNFHVINVSNYRNNSKILERINNRRFSLFIKNPRQNHVCECLFVTNTICNKEILNKYVNIYTDPVIEKLKSKGKECIVLEQENILKYSPMPQGKRFYINQDINDFYKNFKFNKIEVSCQQVEKIIVILTRKNFLKTASFIINNFGMMKFLYDFKYFENLLTQVKAKFVYFTCYYGEKMAFVAAARKMGIQTIDLQHGVQGDYHAAYGGWENVPDTGYLMLPDLFSVWSSQEKDSIIAWSSNLKCQSHGAVVEGNPWLNIWKGSNSFTKHYDELFAKEFSADKGRKRLLFTHQDASLWPEWFPNALQKVSSDTDIFFRLHPGSKGELPYWRKYFNKIGLENIILRRATYWPLLALIRNMDIHVTCHSTCVIEAAALGIQSVVITEDGKMYFKKQIQEGMCEEVVNEVQFLNRISNQKIK